MSHIGNHYSAEVNSQWPASVPKLSSEEAVRSGKRLYRKIMRKPWTGEVVVTSGNRYSWVRRGTMFVNPEQGWKEHVHLLSHYFHSRINPSAPGHGWQHAKLEKTMIQHVLDKGWLGGNLLRPEPAAKEAPTATELRAAKLAKVQASIKRWETKAKRAATALKKLRASERGLSRHL